MPRALIVLFVLLTLGGCFTSMFALNQKLDGPWRLEETDTAQDRVLCRSNAEDGSGCSVEIDAMVFAAGWDGRYIVIARHPLLDVSRPDMTKSEYYYIRRSPEEAKPTWRAAPRGPFSKAQFGNETARLGLPPLTIRPDGDSRFP